MADRDHRVRSGRPTSRRRAAHGDDRGRPGPGL